MSPPWLPAQIAHADWGSAPHKCLVATADLDDDGAYHAHAPRTAGPVGGLLERMHLAYLPGLRAVLGFDFPIGIPEAYAHGAGIEDFADWFRGLDLEAPFFDVAADLAEVSSARPFFPRLIAVKTPGLKERYHETLGLTAAEVLRRTDRAHCARPAASEMFWTLGPKAVGKATLAGWKHAIRPALAERGRRYAIWPYDAEMSELLESSDAVIVETYPAEAYRQLGLRMGTPGTAKTRQADRLADARTILDWCANNAVVPDEELLTDLLQGFGPGEAGEDRFDAVVGLFAMIDTIRRHAEPELPDDPAVRRLEGWIFGQHARCPDAAMSRANAGLRRARADADPPSHRRMSDTERDEILALLEQGLPSGEIAQRLGTPVTRVIAVKANRTMGAYARRSTTRMSPLDQAAITGSPVSRPVEPSERSDGTADHQPRGSDPQVHQSDSAIQRNAEKAILAQVSAHFDAPIAPRTLNLPSGARVEVDGAAPDLSVLVEVFSRQGALKGGQQKKVCQDALKLITVGRDLPDAQLVLAFADEQAAAYATKGSWVADALAAWGVQVLVVDVGEQLRADIRRAQLRQVMVNPSLPHGDRDA